MRARFLSKLFYSGEKCALSRRVFSRLPLCSHHHLSKRCDADEERRRAEGSNRICIRVFFKEEHAPPFLPAPTHPSAHSQFGGDYRAQLLHETRRDHAPLHSSLRLRLNDRQRNDLKSVERICGAEKKEALRFQCVCFCVSMGHTCLAQRSISHPPLC